MGGGEREYKDVYDVWDGPLRSVTFRWHSVEISLPGGIGLKMVYQGKPSSGCATCRKRKIKVGQHPT